MNKLFTFEQYNSEKQGDSTEKKLIEAKRRIKLLQKPDYGFDYETAMRITLREIDVTRTDLENVLRDRWDLVKDFNK